MSRAAVFVAVLSFAASVAAARVGAGESALLTDVAAASFAGHKHLDVVTSRDLREVVELEASKQMIGCADDTSCLAEVAGAMGARYVVAGQLGALGERLVLTVSVFDAKRGGSAGREALQAASIEELSTLVDPAVDRLVALLEPPAAGAREKVLVLDFKATASATPPEAEPPSTGGAGPALVVGGGAAIGAGALIAGVGGLLGLVALAADADYRTADTQKALANADGARDQAGFGATVAFIVGGGIAVVGGVVAGVGALLWSAE